MMRKLLLNKPADNDYWLLRVAGKTITFLAFIFLLLALLLGSFFLYSQFAGSLGLQFGLGFSGYLFSLYFVCFSIVGVVLGQLCHVFADIAVSQKIRHMNK